jgi:hypothetical protein
MIVNVNVNVNADSEGVHAGADTGKKDAVKEERKKKARKRISLI